MQKNGNHLVALPKDIKESKKFAVSSKGTSSIFEGSLSSFKQGRSIKSLYQTRTTSIALLLPLTGFESRVCVKFLS
jgi:outer membrane PBP1 activator LpoA protein